MLLVHFEIKHSLFSLAIVLINLIRILIEHELHILAFVFRVGLFTCFLFPKYARLELRVVEELGQIELLAVFLHLGDVHAKGLVYKQVLPELLAVIFLVLEIGITLVYFDGVHKHFLLIIQVFIVIIFVLFGLFLLFRNKFTLLFHLQIRDAVDRRVARSLILWSRVIVTIFVSRSVLHIIVIEESTKAAIVAAERVHVLPKAHVNRIYLALPALDALSKRLLDALIVWQQGAQPLLHL